MTTNSQNIQKINQKEEAMNNDEQLIKALYDHFSSKPMGFTEYRKQIELLLRNKIKPITSRSSMSLGSNSWRSQLKSRFSGRGAKWVFVSLKNIESRLSALELEGIDCSDYRKNINKSGKAWIRFSGARIDNNIKCAAFEVRTEGSTVDHPKQLHLINIDGLDDVIETMPGTPKALKLEEDSAPMPNKNKEKIVIKKSEETKSKESKSGALSVQEIAADLNEELALPSTPESSDPSDWESFLAVEGLSADFGDEDVFENL